MAVNTKIEFEEAAVDFDARITGFLERGGVISLAVLGLGLDGHTASLFSANDIVNAASMYAMAVTTNQGPDRISVTPALLKKAGQVIVFVAGEAKKNVVEQLEHTPNSVIAGRVLADVQSVEVWYSLEDADKANGAWPS